MSKTVIGIIIAIVIIGGGGYLLVNKKNNNSSTPDDSQSTSQNSSTSSSSNQKAAATITYSGSSFSPSDTTVKAGDTVAVTNNSSGDMQFDSDPHPVHTDDTDLNVGTVSPGQTKTFVVTKTGSFGFHDHLNPSATGHITIQ